MDELNGNMSHSSANSGIVAKTFNLPAIFPRSTTWGAWMFETIKLGMAGPECHVSVYPTNVGESDIRPFQKGGWHKGSFKGGRLYILHPEIASRSLVPRNWISQQTVPYPMRVWCRTCIAIFAIAKCLHELACKN